MGSCDSTNSSCTNNTNSISTSVSSDTIIEYTQSADIDKEEFSFLMSRSCLFDDPSVVSDHLRDKMFVMSDDIVLYYVVTFDYKCVLGLLDKKIKKTVNKLLTNRNVKKEDCQMICTGKLCNIDVQEVYKAYKSLEYNMGYYLYISKCVYYNKEDRDELISLFSHLKDKNIEVFPVSLEEIFLDVCCEYSGNLVLCNIPYRVFLLSKEEVLKYHDMVQADIEMNK